MSEFFPCRGPQCRFTAPVCAWGYCGRCCRKHHTFAIIGETANSHRVPDWGTQGFVVKDASKKTTGTGARWNPMTQAWEPLPEVTVTVLDDTPRCKCGWLFSSHPRPSCQTPVTGSYDPMFGCKEAKAVGPPPEPKVPEPGAFEVIADLEFPIEITEHGYVRGF